MEILTGGRQSGQNLYNALKLYNYINSLPDDTIVRVLKKDGIFCLCTDKSISIQKVKDKIEEYKNMLKTCNKAKDIDRIKAINERILELQELLEGRK